MQLVRDGEQHNSHCVHARAHPPTTPHTYSSKIIKQHIILNKPEKKNKQNKTTLDWLF